MRIQWGRGGWAYQNITAKRLLAVSLYLAPSGETLQLIVALASPLLLPDLAGGAPVVSAQSKGVAQQSTLPASLTLGLATSLATSTAKHYY